MIRHGPGPDRARARGGVAVYSSTVTARSSPRVGSLQVGYSFIQYLRLRYCFAVSSCGCEFPAIAYGVSDSTGISSLFSLVEKLEA
eukprot:2758558-Rhodomonas_salina.1